MTAAKLKIPTRAQFKLIDVSNPHSLMKLLPADYIKDRQVPFIDYYMSGNGRGSVESHSNLFVVGQRFKSDKALHSGAKEFPRDRDMSQARAWFEQRIAKGPVVWAKAPFRCWTTREALALALQVAWARIKESNQ